MIGQIQPSRRITASTSRYDETCQHEGGGMAEVTYETPQITVLGDITDMTLTKPGLNFDYPGSAEGNTQGPPPSTPGTTS
jgi:hypothetical protein